MLVQFVIPFKKISLFTPDFIRIILSYSFDKWSFRFFFLFMLLAFRIQVLVLSNFHGYFSCYQSYFKLMQYLGTYFYILEIKITDEDSDTSRNVWGKKWSPEFTLFLDPKAKLKNHPLSIYYFSPKFYSFLASRPYLTQSAWPNNQYFFSST